MNTAYDRAAVPLDDSGTIATPLNGAQGHDASECGIGSCWNSNRKPNGLSHVAPVTRPVVSSAASPDNEVIEVECLRVWSSRNAAVERRLHGVQPQPGAAPQAEPGPGSLLPVPVASLSRHCH